MILLIFLNWLIIAFVVLTVATQVVLPAFSGTVLFPFFRRRRRELEKKLAGAREEVAEAQIEREVAQVTTRADALRRSQTNTTGSGKRAGEEEGA